MKFIVDEIPKNKSECHFSEWKPYPPIREKTGHYICKIDHKDCNLCKTGCKFMKQEAVVRCRDCKNGEPGACGYGIDCDGVWHDDDWFCADSKRA